MADADIFANYLKYTADTEPPTVYHRWCYLTSLGAVIGRNAYLDMGLLGRVFPTLYVMLLGEPATRKSTAIKMAKRIVGSSGYTTFAADKTRQEKFLLDLEGGIDEDVIEKDSKGRYDAVTAEALWGSSDDREPKHMFIVADEFNDFAGSGNLEFYTMLGSLWDFDNTTTPFTQRFKNSKSVSIYQPTISILSGNTPELFAKAFPPEAIGSGFLSRLLLIHGERSGRRITFPPPPDEIIGNGIIEHMKVLRLRQVGELKKTSQAYAMLDAIYQADSPLYDIRFKAYTQRRFTQLLRLCVIIAAAKLQTEVTDHDVLYANTILSHAEINMPKAIGEFGKGKNSDVANKIMSILEQATKPVSNRELWQQVHKDLASQKDLIDIMSGLLMADKIQTVEKGFLLKKLVRKDPPHVDWMLLTQEERDMI